MDDNKRTAMYAAAYLLETLGHVLETEHKELEDFAMIITDRTIQPKAQPSGSISTPTGPEFSRQRKAGARKRPGPIVLLTVPLTRRGQPP